MLRGRVYLGALLVVSLALAGIAPASAARTSSTTADFRVQQVSAFLGAQSRSFIEIRGVISRSALSGPLAPLANFTYVASRSCSNPGNPRDARNVRISSEWKQSASWLPLVETAPSGSGPLLSWSKRYSFALPDDSSGFYVPSCPSGYRPGALTITSVNLTAWPGLNWLSPPPGMPYYTFALHAGSNNLRGDLSSWRHLA